MKTFSLKPADVERKWFLVDAENQNLGRLASNLASRLRGKDKPEFTPHVDSADYFVVINVKKIAVTGTKEKNKIYYRSSGSAGGLKQRTLQEMREKKPEDILKLAVKGMLPRGPLGRSMLTKLRVFAGSEHKHQANNPEQIEFKN
jgi:large subunit ribosomal protein L13